MRTILTLIILSLTQPAFTQILSLGEAEYLLTLAFDKGNRTLIAKEFEYTSAQTYPNSKWINYRRLDNDRDYEISIQIENLQNNVVACRLITTNFYEANIFKAEIEKRYETVKNSLDGQNLVTKYIGKGSFNKTASFIISIDPSGSGRKAYFIEIRDNQ